MYHLSSSGQYYTCSGLQFFHGFTTIKAGVNRNWGEQQQFFQTLFGNAYPNYSFITPFQVHGPRIQILSSALFNGHTVCPGYDGLLCPHSSQRAVCLFVKSADCLTLLVESQLADLIGAIHLGWQGSLGGIISELGVKLKQLGVGYSDLRVALGPSIGDCCYNIPVMRANLFKAKYPETEAISQHSGEYYFSLPKFAQEELLKLRFLRENIFFRPSCTSCQKDRYFSYRLNPSAKSHLLTFITSNVKPT